MEYNLYYYDSILDAVVMKDKESAIVEALKHFKMIQKK